MNAVDLLDGIAVDARYAGLPEKIKNRVDTWIEIMRAVLPVTKGKRKACKEQAAKLAHLSGFSFRRIETVRDLFINTLDWFESFTDGRGKTEPDEATAAQRSIFNEYMDAVQSGEKRVAHRNLIRDLKAGKSFKGIGDNGGEGTWRVLYGAEFENRDVPAQYPENGWIPSGWSEASFYRCFRDKAQAAAIHEGRGAARKFLPSVITTRVNTYVGQGIYFDDYWPNQNVMVPGKNRTAHFPLSLGAMDHTSACKFAWGATPQIETEEGGRKRISREHMMWFTAHVLLNVGWHPDGTTWFLEKGSASLPQRTIDLLKQWTAGKLNVHVAASIRQEAFAGMFEGRGSSNPNMKALLEEHHHLLTSELAALPGQKGNNWLHAPAWLEKRDAYSRNLLMAAMFMSPELINQFRFPSPLFSKWKAAWDEINNRINWRGWHKLEGWEDCGFYTPKYRLTPHSADWYDEREYLAMSESSRKALDDAAKEFGIQCAQPFAMPPQRVFNEGSKIFNKLPVHLLPQYIESARAEGVPYGQGFGKEIAVNDKHDIVCPGSGDIYDAEVLTLKNRVVPLQPGAGYVAHVNPYGEQFMLLSHLDGSFVGVAKRRVIACKFDKAQVDAATREQKRQHETILGGLARRNADVQQQIRDDIEHNDTFVRAAARDAGIDLEPKPTPQSGAATKPAVVKFDPAKEALRRAELRKQLAAT